MTADFDPRQLVTAAVTMHEFYTSFVEAGFTPDQSLYLVGQALVAGMKNEKSA